MVDWEESTMVTWAKQGWLVQSYYLPTAVTENIRLPSRLSTAPDGPELGGRLPRLEPAIEIDEDLSWFDTPRWQEGEVRVDQHIRAGRVETFPSVEDLISDLHRRAEQMRSADREDRAV